MSTIVTGGYGVFDLGKKTSQVFHKIKARILPKKIIKVRIIIKE